MKFEHNFTMLIAGSTGSGKTEFCKRLIREEMIQPKPEKIYWCYGEYQKAYNDMPGVEFYHGIPTTLYEELDVSKNNLLICDDLMNDKSAEKMINKFFCQGSHHRNLSVIHILQNLFPRSPDMRNISLNSHYIVLFKNPRDKLQITRLASQMGLPKVIPEAFKDATSEKPFTYLILDLKPKTNEELRIRTKIFPADGGVVVYQPR